MPLAPGIRVGPYEILSRIGAGGMGEVWKAHDPRLNRTVAIKTAQEHFSDRFDREARAIAALNHPHICQLYDVGPDYLVMEYIEGEPLAGPLPLDRVLEYATQICAALDAAHRKGIAHRDLKPGNVLVGKSGIKVLDFGLARTDMMSGANDGGATLTQALTQPGAIVGTLQYMAPEQLQAQHTDTRADIFSFGCVLYEMLTGKRAFDGPSAASVIASILERPTPAIAGVAPSSLGWVLGLCLAKDPDKRWQSIADVRAALEHVADAAPEVSQRQPMPSSRRAWIVAGVFALIAVAACALYLRRADSSAPELQLDIATPPTTSPASLALSPDGRRIAYVATVDGVSRLWVRALDSTSVQPIPGSEDALNPFWSPDGRSLGFVVGLELRSVELAGGQPQVIASVAPFAEASWSADNAILYAWGAQPLMRTSPTGRQSSPATALASGQRVHRVPRFLPGGMKFLFFTNGSEPALWLGSLGGAAPRRIAPVTPGTDSAAEYVEPGWLIRVRQNSLVAQRFDPARGDLSGESIKLASGVGVDSDSEAGAFSVSASGEIAWRAGEAAGRQLIWFDRNGRNLGALGPADELVLNPEISPDKQRVAVTRGRLAMSDIWIEEGLRSTRFTTDPADDRIEIWSPDGKQVVFASDRTGTMNLYRKTADGLGKEELLLQSNEWNLPNSWSPDGRFILYESRHSNGDLMVLPLTGERKPFPFLNTPFKEEMGAFSPDGKWVAYDSDESGRFEVYVRPFPGPGAAWQVSTGGGNSPRWRADGGELYFMAPDSTLMAAPVTAHGSAFAAGKPQALFRTHSFFAPSKQQYDVSRDGRFLVVTQLEDTSAEPIHILLNWKLAEK